MIPLVARLRRWFGPRRGVQRDAPPPEAIPQRDPWFRSHYEGAASVVLSLAPPESLARGKHVVDFGCGDGITALGVASRAEAHVVGVDLHTAFLHLPSVAQANLGSGCPPTNLEFRQNEAAQPLPFPDGFADLVYSWSVFEHLRDVEGVLKELHRVLREGGWLFIQIEPLFYSPFGSHLQRLVQEPWAHLLHAEEEFLASASSARDEVPESERDTLYRTHAFEDVKRHLVAEFGRLNRITGPQLSDSVSRNGFAIRLQKAIRIEGHVPPPRLLERYSEDLLLTNQIVLLAQRTAAPPS